MKYFIAVLVCMLLTGCGGASGSPSIQTIQLPAIQEIKYKDILSCVKVDEEFSDCTITHPKYGVGVVVRIQTALIPKPE